jgi:hypothetical protein
MEHLHTPDGHGSIPETSARYTLCFFLFVALMLTVACVAIPFLIQFGYQQVKNITIKTNSAFRYP